MSFALTTEQIRAGTKTVTRRLGWHFLTPGTLIQPVRKGMGLKPGEKVERLRGPIRVVSVRSEQLRRMSDYPAYGIEECAREGFDSMTPFAFVKMFCASHKGCTPETNVVRIEFEYVNDERSAAASEAKPG